MHKIDVDDLLERLNAHWFQVEAALGAPATEFENALTNLKAALTALDFYGDEKNYKFTWVRDRACLNPVAQDRGQKARAVTEAN